MTTNNYLALMLEYVQEVSRAVGSLKPPRNIRTDVAARSLHLSVEHHGSIWLLANSNQIGSAAALVRIQYEAYLRGLWANRLASEDQLRNFFDSDKKPFKPYNEMLKSLATLPDALFAAELSEFHKKFWGPLSSYIHSGGLHLKRRGIEDEIGPSYSDLEVVEILTVSNLVALFATQEFVHVSGGADLEKEALDSYRRVSEAEDRMRGIPGQT